MVSIQARKAPPYNYCYPIANVYRLTEGPDLLALPWSTLLPGNEVGMMDIYAVYAAIEPPEDSVTAELTLHGGKTFTVSGQKEDGIYIFYVRRLPAGPLDVPQAPGGRPSGPGGKGSFWFCGNMTRSNGPCM